MKRFFKPQGLLLAAVVIVGMSGGLRAMNAADKLNNLAQQQTALKAETQEKITTGKAIKAAIKKEAAPVPEQPKSIWNNIKDTFVKYTPDKVLSVVGTAPVRAEAKQRIATKNLESSANKLATASNEQDTLLGKLTAAKTEAEKAESNSLVKKIADAKVTALKTELAGAMEKTNYYLVKTGVRTDEAVKTDAKVALRTAEKEAQLSLKKFLKVEQTATAHDELVKALSTNRVLANEAKKNLGDQLAEKGKYGKVAAFKKGFSDTLTAAKNVFTAQGRALNAQKDANDKVKALEATLRKLPKSATEAEKIKATADIEKAKTDVKIADADVEVVKAKDLYDTSTKELEPLTKQQTELQKSQQKNTDEITALNEEIKTLTSKQQTLTEIIKKSLYGATDSSEEVNTIKTRQSVENDIKKAIAKLEEKTKTKLKLETDLQTTNQTVTKVNEKIAIKRQDYTATLGTKLEHLTTKLSLITKAATEAEQKLTTKTTALNDLKSQITEADGAATKAKEKLDSSNQGYKTLTTGGYIGEAEKEDLIDTIATYQTTLNNAIKKASDLKTAFKNTQTDVKTAEEENRVALAEKTKVETEVQAANQEIQKLQTDAIDYKKLGEDNNKLVAALAQQKNIAGPKPLITLTDPKGNKTVLVTGKMPTQQPTSAIESVTSVMTPKNQVDNKYEGMTKEELELYKPPSPTTWENERSDPKAAALKFKQEAEKLAAQKQSQPSDLETKMLELLANRGKPIPNAQSKAMRGINKPEKGLEGTIFQKEVEDVEKTATTLKQNKEKEPVVETDQSKKIEEEQQKSINSKNTEVIVKETPGKQEEKQKTNAQIKDEAMTAYVKAFSAYETMINRKRKGENIPQDEYDKIYGEYERTLKIKTDAWKPDVDAYLKKQQEQVAIDNKEAELKRKKVILPETPKEPIQQTPTKGVPPFSID